jgi:hypothetical protein
MDIIKAIQEAQQVKENYNLIYGTMNLKMVMIGIWLNRN